MIFSYFPIEVKKETFIKIIANFQRRLTRTSHLHRSFFFHVFLSQLLERQNSSFVCQLLSWSVVKEKVFKQKTEVKLIKWSLIIIERCFVLKNAAAVSILSWEAKFGLFWALLHLFTAFSPMRCPWSMVFKAFVSQLC